MTEPGRMDYSSDEMEQAYSGQEKSSVAEQVKDESSSLADGILKCLK